MNGRPPTIRCVDPRDSHELSREWDNVAEERDILISEGRDLSYRYVLLPALRELSAGWLTGTTRVLDAGCGTGKFATELARDNRDTSIVAIDSSELSIKVARSKRPTLHNLRFENVSIEGFAERPSNHDSFRLVVANMLFQNVASLTRALRACTRVLRPDGALIFAIPHPCFWPRYWKYDRESWFDYGREIWIEAPFRTSLEPNSTLMTTHTHRPLSAYLTAFEESGLLVERLAEPFPDERVEDKYPTAWEYPRFLLGRCRRRPVSLPQSP